jgi:AcrR family transcriptional regulator
MKHHPVVPRERILDTALRLFHEQGYNTTGINQIISEADVAKASLYQHFRSKEELGVQYLKARQGIWFEQLLSFTDESKKEKKKILAAFDFLTFINEKDHFRGCSFLNMLSEIRSEESELLSTIQTFKEQIRQFFADTMENPKDHLSDTVYLLFESAMLESQLFQSQWPVERAKKIVSDLYKLKYFK